MTDREKVIKGLEDCFRYGMCEKDTCPYWKYVDCMEKLHTDALALIRELEAKGKAYDQVKWERDIAVGQLEQIGKNLGEKMDEEEDE